MSVLAAASEAAVSTSMTVLDGEPESHPETTGVCVCVCVGVCWMSDCILEESGVLQAVPSNDHLVIFTFINKVECSDESLTALLPVMLSSNSFRVHMGLHLCWYQHVYVQEQLFLTHINKLFRRYFSSFIKKQIFTFFYLILFFIYLILSLPGWSLKKQNSVTKRVFNRKQYR